MTVLTYAVQTEIAEITPWVGVPAPLMASSGAPLTGALTITITNLTASTVTITSIAFKFDVGTGAALMASASSLQPAPQSGPWVVSNYSETNGVVLEPGVDELGQLEVGESITVQLYGFPTIAAPATAVIGITEKLTPGTSSSSGTLYVTTYAPEFFFNGLTANIMQGSIPVPVAQVLAGTAVTLTWNTSVTERTSITVVYSDPLQGQQTGTLSEPNQWTTPQGLLADTVFTVSVTGTTAGGETATVSESVAVSVLDPTLGNVNVGGDVGAAEPATATLAVTGEVTVAASSSQPTALAVTGNVTVSSATTSGSTFGGTLTTDLLVAGATTNPTPPPPQPEPVLPFLGAVLTDMWVQGTLVAGYPPVSSGNINGGTGYAGGQIIVYGYSSMGVASNYPGVAVLTINGPGVPPATTPASPIPALYLNNPNTTTDSTTIALTAQGNVSISDGTLTVNGSAVQGAAAAFVRNDGDGACLSCTASRSAPRSTTGVTIEVATAEDHGFGTNGLIHSTAGSAPLTHLPTRAGRRVVTSPLSLAAEVHASGTARLSQGRADVELDAGLADLVVHRDDAPYRVLLTPGGSCNGLAVTAKRAGGFTVEELGGGRSDVAFDWLLIGAKRRALDSDEAASLPEELPRRGA